MSTLKRKSKFALTLLLIVAAVGVTVAAFQLDGRARAGIVEWQGKGWKKTEAARLQGRISRYGDWPFLMALGGAGLLVAWRLRNRDWQRILVTAMVASTLAGILANASRLTTGRTRPNAGKEVTPGWYGPFHEGRILVGNPKFNAFPSGHTATAVGFAAVLLFARWPVGILAMLAAFGIAWSRMLLGAHHLSDVVVATLLALAVAWFCWGVARRRGDEIEAWVLAKLPRRA